MAKETKWKPEKAHTKHRPRFFFWDTYGTRCSIEKGASAFSDRLWLGAHENRMHLTKDQAAALVKLLTEFVESGTIPREIEDDSQQEKNP